MRPGRAILFGVLGAAAISLFTALLRGVGVPVSLEIVLGVLVGLSPGGAAFGVGLAMHIVMGALFGLVYGVLFERVWAHGGAPTGMLLSVIHAALIGILVGFTYRFHPGASSQLADPGPYFANAGAVGVLVFFVAHVIYGAIVGGGYGHVRAEKQWAPAGRL